MEIRVDDSYRRRRTRLRVVLMTIWAALYIATVVNFTRTGQLYSNWAVLFAISVAIGLFLQYLFRRSYRCAQCGKRLPSPRTQRFVDSKEWVYDCAVCDIRWRTLTRPPDYDG